MYLITGGCGFRGRQFSQWLILVLISFGPWQGAPQLARGQTDGNAPRQTEQAGREDAPNPVVDPQKYGLKLPPGRLAKGNGRRVLTRNELGETVVGKIHVEVGDYRIVMLPDGQLVARSGQETKATERPFESLTHDELADRLRKGPLQDFEVRKTRRYLYLFNTTESFAIATGRIMESMFPGVATYAQTQRIEVHAPEVPMVVIMFRTEAQFQAYKAMPPGVLAYYDPRTNHVVMFEQASRPPVKPELALQQAISTIAHEGAHQILHNIGVQQRLSRWPMWLTEGLAEYFAPTTTGKRLKWKGAGQVNDMRMFELERYVQSRAGDNPNGDLIDHTVQAARLTSTGYAAAWALTHYLAKNKRKEFHQYIRDVSRLGPLEGDTPVGATGLISANRVLFHKHFGDDFEELERRLVLHLKKLPYRDPFAEFPHYVGLALVPGEKSPRREARLFHTQGLAEKWRRDLAQGNGQAAASQSAIRVFPNRAVAEQFIQQWLRGR